MDAKQEVRELLDRLPDDVELKDVLYQLYVYVSVQEGLREAEAGNTIPHEQVVEELRQKWLRRAG